MAQSQRRSHKRWRRSTSEEPGPSRGISAPGKLVVAAVVIAVLALIILLFSPGGSLPGSLPG